MTVSFLKGCSAVYTPTKKTTHFLSLHTIISFPATADRQSEPCLQQGGDQVDGGEEGYHHHHHRGETFSCSPDGRLRAPGTKKRSRAAFTHAQVHELERRFSTQKYLSGPERADLAGAL